MGIPAPQPKDCRVPSARCAQWWEDGVPAVEAVATAAAEPLLVADFFGMEDLASEGAVDEQDPKKLRRLDQLLVEWLEADDPQWVA